MSDDSYDAIMSKAPAKGPLRIPLIGLLLGIAGTVVMVFSFTNGIPAALDGSGNGADPFLVLFGVGAAMAIAAIVLGIIGIRRGGHSVVSVFAILVGLLPGLLTLLIFFLNALTVCCAQPPVSP